ncbi:MAG TPA: 2-oxoglutarate dehydrogenase complex dihydrolipoyllysine-residue succinyltransferase [Anaeromyxobacteraceae bacterium]|nr:2-oxoglutarate dehydrogenase complex dihydrolipoyllysine-residue succinyltransferase [Anaeromyxobacteraceae bacterium]
MAIDLRVPALGESITQATIGNWLKKEGDAVQADEPVVEVESEKATVALPAPAAGVLRKILKASGATVAVGEVVGVLEAGGGARAPEAPAPAPPEKAEAPPKAEKAPPSSNGAPLRPLRAPPSVRRQLAEEGLEAGSAGGVLRRVDLERALALKGAPAPEPPPRPLGENERAVPMSPLRRTVARRLLEAQQNAAILTTFNEIDMSRVLALRERHGPAFQERHGVKLGFMSFFVKAAVEALRAFPVVNAEVRGTDLIYKDHYDIGVAVGGGKGLVVPVVRGADGLSFAEVEKRIAELAQKARENRIAPADLEGGTFTISNGGVYGSLLSTPILNPPQSGILGLHKIEKRAVVGQGDEVVVRPMMYLALSYDHRIIDGREAVSFLVRVKECLEEPERLLLEA